MGSSIVEAETIEVAPGIRAYKHKPYLVPVGKAVYELDLITGRIRRAEWQDVSKQPAAPKLWERVLIYCKLRKPAPKPVPIMQLVEYDDCVYIPIQMNPDAEAELKLAKRAFGRVFRMAR